MAGTETDEAMGIIINTTGQVIQGTLELTQQLIKTLWNIIHGGYSDNQKQSLLSKGKEWLTSKVPKTGERGNISISKIHDRAGDNAYTVVSREDLNEYKKQMKRHGVDFAVIPRSDGNYHLVFKAADAQTMEAAALAVASKLGMNQSQIQELQQPDLTEESFQQTNPENPTQAKAFLSAPKEKMDYAQQSWTLEERSDNQIAYTSEFKSFDIKAFTNGKYQVSQMGKEIYSGKSIGGLQSAMLDGTIAARSANKAKELQQGITTKKVGGQKKAASQKRPSPAELAKNATKRAMEANKKLPTQNKTKSKGAR